MSSIHFLSVCLFFFFVFFQNWISLIILFLFFFFWFGGRSLGLRFQSVSVNCYSTFADTMLLFYIENVPVLCQCTWSCQFSYHKLMNIWNCWAPNGITSVRVKPSELFHISNFQKLIKNTCCISNGSKTSQVHFHKFLNTFQWLEGFDLSFLLNYRSLKFDECVAIKPCPQSRPIFSIFKTAK